MGHEPRLEPLRQALGDQSRDVAIEAVYQTGIILRHALNKEEFLARTKIQTKMPYQEFAIERVLDMVDALEREEGSAVEELPSDVRDAYIRRLGELVPPDPNAIPVTDPKVQAMLKDLREFVVR